MQPIKSYYTVFDAFNFPKSYTAIIPSVHNRCRFTQHLRNNIIHCVRLYTTHFEDNFASYCTLQQDAVSHFTNLQWSSE